MLRRYPFITYRVGSRRSIYISFGQLTWNGARISDAHAGFVNFIDAARKMLRFPRSRSREPGAAASITNWN